MMPVDDVMQALGAPDEDREDGFAHGVWSVKCWDDIMGSMIIEQTLQPDTLLLLASDKASWITVIIRDLDGGAVLVS